MAATVLNGSGNLSYTNNTGGNVRAIIYYMSSTTVGGQQGINVSSTFGTSAMSSGSTFTIGKDIAGSNIAITSSGVPMFTGQNVGGSGTFTLNGAIPTQIMLANGQTLSATCGGYNIAIIPENG